MKDEAWRMKDEGGFWFRTDRWMDRWTLVIVELLSRLKMIYSSVNFPFETCVCPYQVGISKVNPTPTSEPIWKWTKMFLSGSKCPLSQYQILFWPFSVSVDMFFVIYSCCCRNIKREISEIYILRQECTIKPFNLKNLKSDRTNWFMSVNINFVYLNLRLTISNPLRISETVLYTNVPPPKQFSVSKLP